MCLNVQNILIFFVKTNAFSWASCQTGAVMHVEIAAPRWRGKRPRHSRHMHNPHLYVSGKRPIDSFWPTSKMTNVLRKFDDIWLFINRHTLFWISAICNSTVISFSSCWWGIDRMGAVKYSSWTVWNPPSWTHVIYIKKRSVGNRAF